VSRLKKTSLRPPVDGGAAGRDDPSAVAPNAAYAQAPDGAGDSVASPHSDREARPTEAPDPSREGTKDPENDGESDMDAPIEIERARFLPRVHLRGLLEALVFASDKPMSTHELAKMASAPLREVKEILGELRETYAHRGIVLGEVAGGWLFRTSAQFAPFVRELTSEPPVRLSRAQLETLAIAAYRQPITRPEIDDIRGVDSGATLKLLLERDLLRIIGKKDEPGRPLLYATTGQFLEFFGLKSLKELPTLREFAELSDESRRVAEAVLGDVLPDARGAASGEPEPTTEKSDATVDTGALTGGAEASDAGANAALDEAAITDPERVLGGFDETGAERWPRETDAQEGFVEAPEREADDDPGGEPG
jgi:segregation and condensation protein B